LQRNEKREESKTPDRREKEIERGDEATGGEMGWEGTRGREQRREANWR
jgi:hypothetical protein